MAPFLKNEVSISNDIINSYLSQNFILFYMLRYCQSESLSRDRIFILRIDYICVVSSLSYWTYFLLYLKSLIYILSYIPWKRCSVMHISHLRISPLSKHEHWEHNTWQAECLSVLEAKWAHYLNLWKHLHFIAATASYYGYFVWDPRKSYS